MCLFPSHHPPSSNNINDVKWLKGLLPLISLHFTLFAILLLMSRQGFLRERNSEKEARPEVEAVEGELTPSHACMGVLSSLSLSVSREKLHHLQTR